MLHEEWLHFTERNFDFKAQHKNPPKSLIETFLIMTLYIAMHVHEVLDFKREKKKTSLIQIESAYWEGKTNLDSMARVEVNEQEDGVLVHLAMSWRQSWLKSIQKTNKNPPTKLWPNFPKKESDKIPSFPSNLLSTSAGLDDSLGCSNACVFVGQS
jgi:hypothetical protein